MSQSDIDFMHDACIWLDSNSVTFCTMAFVQVRHYKVDLQGHLKGCHSNINTPIDGIIEQQLIYCILSIVWLKDHIILPYFASHADLSMMHSHSM